MSYVLIACEESQRVCEAFRKVGHTAFSADIQKPSGGHNEWNILGDVLDVLDGGTFRTMDGRPHTVKRWALVIAHPPCTYLTVTGNRWYNVEKYGDKARERESLRRDAIAFFMRFTAANADRIAIENPIGYMNTHYKKPTQIIHPYYFGDPVRKATCLWLYNLPPLNATNIVPFETRGRGYSGAAFAAYDENGKTLRWNDPRTAKERSKTFPGIAAAMAEQWGYLI